MLGSSAVEPPEYSFAAYRAIYDVSTVRAFLDYRREVADLRARALRDCSFPLQMIIPAPGSGGQIEIIDTYAQSETARLMALLDDSFTTSTFTAEPLSIDSILATMERCTRDLPRPPPSMFVPAPITQIARDWWVTWGFASADLGNTDEPDPLDQPLRMPPRNNPTPFEELEPFWCGDDIDDREMR